MEQANVLEGMVGAGRVEVSTSTCKKMHFVTHGAHRQGKQAYQVDIDFRNAFNTMSQVALWHVINMFHIPDVDLLEQIYDNAIVHLARNDAESATITSMQSIWKCKIRIEKIGGSRVLWIGEESMKKGMLILKSAEFESAEDLPKTALGFRSKAYQDLPPQLRSSTTSNGEQRVRVLVPNAQGLHRATSFLIHEYLNLVDCKGLELLSTWRRCKVSVEKFERSQLVWAE